jgi:hypothetical protein
MAFAIGHIHKSGEIAISIDSHVQLDSPTELGPREYR